MSTEIFSLISKKNLIKNQKLKFRKLKKKAYESRIRQNNLTPVFLFSSIFLCNFF